MTKTPLCGGQCQIVRGSSFREVNGYNVNIVHGEDSDAYKIISHSKNPVITVRRGKMSSNIDRIVLPLDITLQTREKVPYTVKLAKLFNSEIHLLTVRSSKLKSIEKKLHRYAEQVATYLDTHEISYTVEHLQR